MSDILRRAREHFEGQKNRTVAVPEWGAPGEPLIIHFDAMNMRERRKVFEKAAKNDLSASVDALILMARDAHGRKLFTEDHRHPLMTEVDSAVVARIAAQIMQAEEFTPESAEKNCETTAN